VSGQPHLGFWLTHLRRRYRHKGSFVLFMRHEKSQSTGYRLPSINHLPRTRGGGRSNGGELVATVMRQCVASYDDARPPPADPQTAAVKRSKAEIRKDTFFLSLSLLRTSTVNLGCRLPGLCRPCQQQQQNNGEPRHCCSYHKQGSSKCKKVPDMCCVVYPSLPSININDPDLVGPLVEYDFQGLGLSLWLFFFEATLLLSRQWSCKKRPFFFCSFNNTS